MNLLLFFIHSEAAHTIILNQHWWNLLIPIITVQTQVFLSLEKCPFVQQSSPDLCYHCHYASNQQVYSNMAPAPSPHTFSKKSFSISSLWHSNSKPWQKHNGCHPVSPKGTFASSVTAGIVHLGTTRLRASLLYIEIRALRYKVLGNTENIAEGVKWWSNGCKNAVTFSLSKQHLNSNCKNKDKVYP